MRRYVGMTLAGVAGATWAALAGHHDYVFSSEWYRAAGRTAGPGEPDPLVRYMIFIAATASAALLAVAPLAFCRGAWRLLAAPAALIALVASESAIYGYIYQGFTGHISIQSFYRYVPEGSILLGFVLYGTVAHVATWPRRTPQ